MKSRSLRPRSLAVAVAALVAASGLSADRSFAVARGDDARANKAALIGISGTQGTARYIVRFVEQPLAQYNSVVASKPVNGLGAIPLKTMKNGRSRLDVHSSQAANYVQYLKTQQQQHIDAINTALHQNLTVRYSMQHALNAIVTDLTAAQVALVQKVPGVVAVERDRPHALATDIGPGFIGAASVWWGASAGQDTIFASSFDAVSGFLGDGMVIGDIDTGYNSSSPSFAATDAHGYTIQNPLGSGNFIGQCSVPGISDAGCNDKVIGVYDEIDLTNSDPPFVSFSVEDQQDHGSHTASTAGGNFRSGTISGYTANLAGVAPHANLVIYYACSPNPNVKCSTAATTASVDQAIQDGVVDALNYSISGGNNPWNDSTSLAFLSATDAGIFVAAAAGNTSTPAPPLPGSANHAEPWVTTVAASTHTGAAIGFLLTVNGAGAPGPVPLTPAASGTGLGASVANEPIVSSPTYGTAGDGCAAFTGTPFTGSIALLTFTASCGTNTMSGNAIAAGADYVLIVANTDGPFLSGANRPKPVFTTGLTIGNSLHTYVLAHAGTTINIAYPPSRLPQQPDELAGFSLLGPVDINMLKPDMEAPGVSILAAYSNAGDPNVIGLLNGTSMATPHTTGSGALLMGLHPDWTPSEAKSALMMTAKEAGLTKADGTTASDYFDRGSGRLQDFVASKAGLVMDESGLNYANADPGAGGEPSSLNVASMQDAHCVTNCSFVRKFHSTQDHTVTWTASVAPGSDAGLAITVTPSSFPATAHHDTAPVTIAVNDSALASDGDLNHFAEIVLTPSDTSLTPLHLTMAIAMPAPTIAAAPSPLSITGVGAGSANATLTVSNLGGPTLNVTRDTTSTPAHVWQDQISGDAFGFTSTQYTGLAPGNSDFFVADDFRITGTAPINLTKIFTPGFTPNNPLSSFGPTMPVHWRIYSSNDNLPSSDPDTAGPAVWSYDATAGSPGVSVAGPFGGDISLDLVAAGQNTALPAGHYWLVVYPTLPCNSASGAPNGCTEGWDWLNSNAGNDSPPVGVGPQAGQPWSPTDPAAGKGFAMHLESASSCVPPAWLSATGFPLAIAGNSSADVTVTATSPLGGSSATAYLCLASNDPSTPLLSVQVNATGGTGGPVAPTVAKAFLPTSVGTGANSTATITLANPNNTPAALSAALTDTLPANLVATAGTAATTCTGGTGASIAAGGGSVTLASGAAIPANGSCTVSFTVTSATAATYTNTITAGVLQTDKGNNASAASANLTVNAVVCTQPIQDPGFEATAADLSSNPFWTSTSTNFGNGYCTTAVCATGGGTANVHGGTVWMWMGGQDIVAPAVAETTTASQTVVIPSGSPRFLNFWLWIGAVTNPAAGTMVVKVDGTTVHSYPAPATAEAGYTQRSIDVSAFANGASHTILFQYSAPFGETENYSLDDVTLDCAAPPIVAPRPATNPPTGPTTRLIH